MNILRLIVAFYTQAVIIQLSNWHADLFYTLISLQDANLFEGLITFISW